MGQIWSDMQQIRLNNVVAVVWATLISLLVHTRNQRFSCIYRLTSSWMMVLMMISFDINAKHNASISMPKRSIAETLGAVSTWNWIIVKQLHTHCKIGTNLNMFVCTLTPHEIEDTKNGIIVFLCHFQIIPCLSSFWPTFHADILRKTNCTAK